jgi:hypothetical protein
MRTPIGSVSNNTPTVTSPGYSPSVPLSVYRDLASELQAVRAKLDVLSTQNQQLLQENQLLKQEIAKTVGSVLHLQKLVDSQPKGGYRQAPSSSHFKTEPKKPNEAHSEKQVFRPRPPVVFSEVEMSNPISEPMYIEEQEENYLLDSEPESSQINRFWLIISILFIIVMGFGAGYLIVRPFLESQNR